MAILPIPIREFGGVDRFQAADNIHIGLDAETKQRKAEVHKAYKEGLQVFFEESNDDAGIWARIWS
jgi:hypothetical protein